MMERINELKGKIGKYYLVMEYEGMGQRTKDYLDLRESTIKDNGDKVKIEDDYCSALFTDMELDVLLNGGHVKHKDSTVEYYLRKYHDYSDDELIGKHFNYAYILDDELFDTITRKKISIIEEYVCLNELCHMICSDNKHKTFTTGGKDIVVSEECLNALRENGYYQQEVPGLKGIEYFKIVD